MKNRKTSKVTEIIENVTVTYTDKNEEHFDVILITDKGIQIGRILDKKFEPFGFIPNHSIKKINNTSGKRMRKKSEFLL